MRDQTDVEAEPKISVTPLKQATKFQKKKNKKTEIDENDQRFKSFDVVMNGRKILVKYDEETEDILINGKLYPTTIEEDDRFLIAKVEQDHVYSIEYHEGQIYLEGRLIEFDFKPAVPKLVRKKGINSNDELILSPLPGQVIALSVKVGERVKKGQKLLFLEAMKMQNEIICQREGTVAAIYVKVGDSVGSYDKLVLIKVS